MPGSWSMVSNMLAFYWRWIRTAFTHSLLPYVGVYDLWVGLLSAFISVADHYFPAMHMMEVHGWQVPIIVLAALVLVRLVLAPYWMRLEDGPAQSGMSNIPAPDMTIRDLFILIDPKAADGNRRFAIGRAVRDKLSTMELFSWGRPTQGWIDGVFGASGALEDVPFVYWRSAYFSYSFLGEVMDITPHTQNSDMHSREAAYCDMRVSRTQVAKIDWTTAVSDAAKYIDAQTKSMMS